MMARQMYSEKRSAAVCSGNVSQGRSLLGKLIFDMPSAMSKY
jgi:hypothetical protein